VFIETDVLTAAEWRRSSQPWRRARSSRPVVGRRDARGDRGGVRRLVDVAVPGFGRRARLGLLVPGLGEPVQAHRRGLLPPGEAFDSDPFLIFAWRGRTKEELLTGLRARRRGSDSNDAPESRAVAKTAGNGPFGWPVADPERIAARQGPARCSHGELTPILRASRPDPPGRRLRSGPPPARPHTARHRRVRITEELRGLYEAITAGAAALASTRSRSSAPL